MARQRIANPIYPNAGVDAWYRTQLEAIVTDVAQDTLDCVRRAWRDGGGIAQDTRRLTTPVLLQRALERSGRRWAVRMDKTAGKLALQFAQKARTATEVSMMRQLKDAGFTVKFKSTPRIRQAFDAIAAENVGLIKSIPAKYHADVQQAIWQNVSQGSDLAKIADDMVEKYGIAHRRAAFIAKDQNHKAKAAIERTRRLDVGITKAKWRHSHAGKDPRPTHVKMDGEEYDIADGMWDTAVQKNIWPGTEPHCRCTDAPVIPGFDIK